MIKTTLTFTIFIFLFLSFFFSPVFAIETGKMGIYPTFWDKTNPITKSWFVYQMDKNQEKEDQATVINNTGEELTVKIYPVDAKTTADGAFSPLLEEEAKNDVGAWITLPVSELTLKPHEKKEIKFTISIPDNAPVGEHAGAIIIEEVKPEQANEAGVGLNIKQRVGVRVYVTIPGEKQVKLEWQDFSFTKIGDQYAFLFKLENQGNIILNPQTEIVVKQIWGNRIKTFEKQSLGSIFPGKTTSPKIRWEDTPNFAIARAFATITFNSQKLSRSSWVIIFPWKIALPLLILLIVAAFWKLRHFIFHHDQVKKFLQIPEPDTAEDHHHKNIITIVIVLAGVLVGLAIFTLVKLIDVWQLRQKTTTSQIQINIPPSPMPTPLALTDEEKKNLNIVILNASGIRFSASEIKEFLEKKGYRIKRIGNEDGEYQKTVVSYRKKELQTAAFVIVDELKTKYSSPSAKINKEQTEDIIIYLGKDKKKNE